MIEKAKRVLQELHNHKFQTSYLVGGSVRDILLGKTPKDWDICTSATPEQIKKVFQNHYEVGEKFGTVGVHFENSQFEITTFRSEANYDGRRPEKVVFETDPIKDVLRRDFTINGLLMDKYGMILDFVDGQEDLKTRTIRCIGQPKDRFEEDYLRILRGLRFSCQLKFEFDDHTYSQMSVCASGLEKISRERINEELAKMLTSPEPHVAMFYMTQIGAWKYIIPEINDLMDCEQPPQYHKYDVYDHTRQMLHTSNKPLTFEMGMAILLHDIGKPRSKGFHNGRITLYGHENVGAEMSKDICNRLRLSNAQEQHITWLVKNHMKPHQSTKMNKSTLAKLCRAELIEELIELNRLDCLNSNGDMTNYNCINKFYIEEFNYIKQKPLLKGDYLTALGYKHDAEKGIDFKKILDTSFTLQLEGKINSIGQAIDWIIGGMK